MKINRQALVNHCSSSSDISILSTLHATTYDWHGRKTGIEDFSSWIFLAIICHTGHWRSSTRLVPPQMAYCKSNCKTKHFLINYFYDIFVSVWLKLAVNIFLSKLINPEAQNAGLVGRKPPVMASPPSQLKVLSRWNWAFFILAIENCESWNCFINIRVSNCKNSPDVFKYFSNNKKELVKINQYWLRCSVWSLSDPSTQIIIVIHKKDIFHISPDYYSELKFRSSNSMNLLHF